MATFVNANFWIYFIRTDDDDRVKCKICRKSLKSKRSFNLRQHLKHAHKIEVRSDKKISNVKNQQLLTCSNEAIRSFKGANFWAYFTNSDRADKVTCKICTKKLKSNYGFNLKQHLKLTHKIEVRLEKRISKKKKQHENSSLEIKNRGSQTLDSNDSFSRVSTSPTIDIKEECVQEVLVKAYSDTVDQESPFEVNNHENDKNEESSKEDPLTSTISYDKSPTSEVNNRKTDNKETLTQNPPIPPLYYTKPDAFVEPLAMQRENRRDPLNTFDIRTNGDEFEPRPKKRNMTRSVDEESGTSHKNDNFELWVKKKKQLLEIEELEIRNYKLKLELWEKEQQLHLICSKFTRDIKSSI